MIVNDAKEQRIINSRWFVPLDNPHRPWHPFPRTNFRENYGQRSEFTVGELYLLGRKVALSKNRVELISSFETKVYRTSPPRTRETKRKSNGEYWNKEKSRDIIKYYDLTNPDDRGIKTYLCLFERYF